ncbi:Acyl-CoA N-acyltransferase [Phytophthora palmivora]|uniref:Acyl-CoA N-acyltransferase n=1 Tax=Phytophthora palmivora TaxID=4796 RepID=A0A2P4YVT7_9STRA|nr:Acyl-CoA N-acyltransferase [Phytophthora palmivora]
MELHCLTNDAALVRAVQKLNMGVLPVQPPRFCYRRAEKDKHRLSWAAVVDGEIVSGAAVADLELERSGLRTVQLRTLAVSAPFRRQGIGRKLVMKIIEQAKELGKGEDGDKIQGVRLHVHAGNDEALAFYKALGFVEKARVENYYRHLEPSTAFVMEYPLH